MIVTLIILAFAGPPGEAPERLENRYVVPNLLDCQAFMRTKVGEIWHARPDVQSVAATCLMTTGDLDL